MYLKEIYSIINYSNTDFLSPSTPSPSGEGVEGLKSGIKKFLCVKQISDNTSLYPLPIAIGRGAWGS